MDNAAASASSLAPAGMTQTTGHLGPCLFENMGEALLMERLNAWGTARDREAVALRTDLSATQVGVMSAFEQAQATLLGIVEAFRTEAATMRHQAFYEAQQSIARLEQVVADARLKFNEQDLSLIHI